MDERRNYSPFVICALAVFIQVGAPTSLLKAQISTVRLDEVVIAAEAWQRYAPGSKKEEADSLTKILYSRSSLSDLLLQTTSLHFREYGNGMLSSISFRGTGPAHTSLLWHGINLNSVTLGQSDFSQYSVFMFDDIALQYGGAGSLNGSDAVGGSIHLLNQPQWLRGWNMQLQQETASFGGYFSGLKIQAGNGKLESRTRLFHRSLRNDFPYTQQDRLGQDFTVRQQNAGIRMQGLMQELAGRIGPNSWVALHFWHQEDSREIQPQMVSAPGQDQGGEQIDNRNSRLLAELHHNSKAGYLNLSSAYLADRQVYNLRDSIFTGRLANQLSFEGEIGLRFRYRIGAQLQYIEARSRAFSGLASEWRNDLYASVSYQFNPAWLITLNLRYFSAPGIDASPAPSLSTSYTFSMQEGRSLTLRALAERSYRIPTFNDRYWRDQGRIDLHPERGYSAEIGGHYKRSYSRSVFNFDLAGYFLELEDWITWQPSAFLSDRNGDGMPEQVVDWRPFNLKKIRGAGIEFSGSYGLRWRKWKLSGTALVAYQRSILETGLSENDPAVGRQLPHTPKIRYSISARAGYRGYSLDVIHYYTGMRTTQDVFFDLLDDFALTNITASKSWLIFSQPISASVGIRNAFDVAYQNMKRFAMPGRNYFFCLRFDLSPPKSDFPDIQ